MAGEESTIEDKITAQLSAVIEPVLQHDLVSLDMIRDVKVEGDTANFTIVLTTPAHPHKASIKEEAREAALSVDGINDVELTVVSEVPPNPRIKSQLNLDLKSLIAVSSGKGGVGKSTIAANIAVALSQAGAAVGLMDADILGPNLPIMMGIDKIPPPVNQRLIPAEAHGVKVMSMGFLVDPEEPMVWRGPMLHSAIRQFFSDVEWGALDYMVIDLPPGTGDAQLTLAQSVPLTGAVIVTQPQEVALGDALRGLAMFEKLDVPIIGVVENMSGELFGQGGGEKLADRRGVPYLGSVPLDSQVRVGGDGGSPVVISQPDSEVAQALTRVAEEVAARVSVLTLRQQDDSVISLETIG